MAQYRDEALMQQVALRLKKLREDKGVSQEHVYNETDVHIGRIEAGQANLTVSTLSKLCDYYGTSLTEFFKKIQ